jgi:anti-sigma factor RsiW
MDSDFSRDCARADELMGFLYGELNDVEAKAFRGHLQQCATCNSELSSFGGIRDSIVAWRNESFSSLSSPGVNLPAPKPSAVAALREFFNLSPAWMKVAVGFASLLFCVFAVLAVFGLRQSSEPAIVKVETSPTADQINLMVQQRVEEELRRVKAQTAPVVAENTPSPIKQTTDRRSNRTIVRYQNNARRPLTRVEREQLAADLRLTSSPDDNELVY